MAEVAAELTLDDSSAVGVVDDLASALDDMVANFADQFSAAMSGAGSSVSAIDTTGLGSNVGAIDVPVTVDTTEADAALSQLDDSAATTSGDLGGVQDAADSSTTALDQTASSSTDAAAGLNTASDASQTMASSASTASGGIDAMGGSVKALQGTSALAAGDIEGLGNVVGDLGPGMGTAVAGVGALAGGLGVMVNSAVSTESAIQRADSTLGAFKSSVENIKVGDLSTSLNGLAASMGESQTAMLTVATNAFQFATAADEGGAAASRFSNEVVALASRAVALNPTLGSVAQVANTLQLRLATGGLFLAQYGIALDQTSIKQLAMAETGKTTAASLTTQEKSIAGADLATQKYGSTLQESIANASKNVEIQVRQLKSAFDDFIGTMAKPLIAPVLEIFKELIPAGEDAAKILMTLGQDALPVLVAALSLVAPAMNALVTVVDTLNPVLGPLVTAFVALEAASAVEGVLAAVGTAMGVTLVPAGGLAAAMDFLGLSFGRASGEAGTFGVTTSLTEAQLATLGPTAEADSVAIDGLAASEEAAGAASVVMLGPLAAIVAVGAAAEVGLSALSGAFAATDVTTGNFKTSTNALATDSVPKLTQSLKTLVDGIDTQNVAILRSNEAQNLQYGILASDQSTISASTEIQKLWSKAKQDGAGAEQTFISALQASSPHVQSAAGGVQKYTDQLNQTKGAAAAAAQGQAQLQVATDPLTTSLKDAAIAAGTEVQSMNDLSDALLAAGNADIAAAQAGAAFEKAVASGDQTTIESTALKVDAATKAKTYSDEILAGVAPQTASADAILAGNKALQDAANALPPNSPAKQALDALILQMDAYGQKHPTPTLDANTAPAQTKIGAAQQLINDIKQGAPIDVLLNDEKLLGTSAADQKVINDIKQGKPIDVILNDLATAKAAEIQATLDQMHGVNLTIDVSSNIASVVNSVTTGIAAAEAAAANAKPPGKMAGGSVSPGMYVVGEAGPELFYTDQSGTIVPNDQLGSVTGSGGGMDSAAAALTQAANVLAQGGGSGQISLIVVDSVGKAIAMLPRSAQPTASAFLAGRS